MPLHEVAERHKGVAKFLQMRSQKPDGLEVVKGFPGPMAIWSLHAGRDRGLTAHDREYGVVWLLAFGIHRSGERSDLYKYAEILHDAGRLMPEKEDYERLLRRRNAKIVPAMLSRLAALQAQARAELGQTQTVRLPFGVVVSLRIEQETQHSGLLPGLETKWLAIETDRLQRGWLPIIQGALIAHAVPPVWQYTQEFPLRAPDLRELRFTCQHEVD